MARDAKLVFNFTRDVTSTVGNGFLNVNTFNAVTTATGAFIYVPALGGANAFLRGTSNSLNRAGFRDQQADQSQLATSNSIVSAITNDPAVFGNTEMYEGYARITYGGLGTALAANCAMWVVVEAASDSGTGTAGTDWSPVSNSINLATPVSAQQRVASGTTLGTGTSSNGTFTQTTGTHGLSVGDIIVFTAITGGTSPNANQPYYVAAVPAANQFQLALTPNGPVVTTFNGTTSYTITATPAARRVVSVSIAPTVKPWLRIAVYGTSTAAAQQAAFTGVWLQDAFITLGRDSAALA